MVSKKIGFDVENYSVVQIIYCSTQKLVLFLSFWQPTALVGLGINEIIS